MDILDKAIRAAQGKHKKEDVMDKAIKIAQAPNPNKKINRMYDKPQVVPPAPKNINPPTPEQPKENIFLKSLKGFGNIVERPLRLVNFLNIVPNTARSIIDEDPNTTPYTASIETFKATNPFGEGSVEGQKSWGELDRTISQRLAGGKSQSPWEYNSFYEMPDNLKKEMFNAAQKKLGESREWDSKPFYQRKLTDLIPKDTGYKATPEETDKKARNDFDNLKKTANRKWFASDIVGGILEDVPIAKGVEAAVKGVKMLGGLEDISDIAELHQKALKPTSIIAKGELADTTNSVLKGLQKGKNNAKLSPELNDLLEYEKGLKSQYKPKKDVLLPHIEKPVSKIKPVKYTVANNYNFDLKPKNKEIKPKTLPGNYKVEDDSLKLAQIKKQTEQIEPLLIKADEAGIQVDYNKFNEAAAKGDLTKFKDDLLNKLKAPVKNEMHIDNRTFDDVGKRSIKSFQSQNSHAKPYIQEEAKRLLDELQNSTKGEKIVGYDLTGEKIYQSGTKRHTSKAIERILDLKEKPTYKQIQDELENIIADGGTENHALAKRIELIIDDNLTSGTKSLYGKNIAPNQAYIKAKNSVSSVEIPKLKYHIGSTEKEVRQKLLEQTKKENLTYDFANTLDRKFIKPPKQLRKKVEIPKLKVEPVKNNRKIYSQTDNSIRNYDDVINEIVKETGKEKRTVVTNNPYADLTIKEKKPNIFNKIIDTTIGTNAFDPETEALKLSKNNPNSTFYKYAYHDINMGQREKYKFLQDGENFFKSKGIDIDSHKNMKDMLKPTSIDFNGKKINLTKGEKISLYLQSQNLDNVKHITEGGIRTKNGTNIVKLSPEDLKTITLTPDEKKIADVVSDYFENIQKKAINKTSKIVDGKDIATVENYFPILTDSMNSDTYMPKYFKNKTLEGIGILKNREHGTNTVILENVFDAVKRTSEDTSNYCGYTIPVQNMKGIIGDKRIKNVLADKDIKYYDDLLKKLEGNYAIPNDYEKVTRKLVGNVQRSILGLNPPIWFKQLASLPTAAAEINPKYIIQGITRKADWNLIEKHSPMIWYRRKGYITREAGDVISKHKDWVTKPISAFDSMAIGKLWNAAEAETKALKPALKGDDFYKAVAKRTEDIIYRTQPNYTLMQRSPLGSSDSTLTKLATMFSTQTNKNYNLLVRAGMNLKSNSQKSIQQMSAVSASAVTVALINMAKSKWRGYKDNFGKELGSAFAGNVYFAGDIYNLIANGYGMEAPTEAAMTNFIKSTANLFKTNSDTSAGKIKKFATELSHISGVPVKNVTKTFEAALRRIDPILEYQWKKIFTQNTQYNRRERYKLLFDELEKDKPSNKLPDLIKDLKLEGVTRSSLKRSSNYPKQKTPKLQDLLIQFPKKNKKQKGAYHEQ